jgi:hypothetical protein
VNERRERATVAGHVEKQRRRHLVPVPRPVPVILVVTPDLPRLHVEREHRVRVEVVAVSLITDPRPGVSRSPIGQTGRRIVVTGQPHRRTSRAPCLARPGIVPEFSRCGYGVCPPDLGAGFGVESRNESANAELSAGHADHDSPFGGERRDRHVVAGGIVRDRDVPHEVSTGGVEGQHTRVQRRHVHTVFEEGDTPVRVVNRHESVGQVVFVHPEQVPGARVEGEELVLRSRHIHHPVVHDGRRLVPSVHSGREAPDGSQPPDVLGRDLIERAEAPTRVVAPIAEPVFGFRIVEPLLGHGSRRGAGLPGRCGSGSEDAAQGNQNGVADSISHAGAPGAGRRAAVDRQP